MDAVSVGNLRETAPMVLARCKTAAYKSNTELRRPLEVEREIEASISSTSEEDFKPQKVNVKRGSTDGQTGEVDVGKEWVSKGHQATGKQVTSDPLERSKTRNTSRPWWVALETLKEMEDCLKKLDSGVARKRRNWATQQKAEVNKIELANQLKRSWQNLLKDHFELPKEPSEKTILKKSKRIPIEIILKSKIVRETLKAKGYDLNQVEAGTAQIDDDLMRLLEKLSDEKPVIQEKGQEEPEVTILRRKETVNNTDSSRGSVTDSKDVVRSLVDKIPENILEQTNVRKKKVTFKEDTEHLGLGQQSGECSMFTEEETGEGKLSGEREEWDEDSDESSENQDSLCMILAEEKTRHHDRELQTDPSSGTYNLDVQETRGGEELEKIAVSRKPFRELSCNSNVRTNLVPEDDMKIVKRMICVKLSDDIHNPGEMNGQIMALKEHVTARYRLSDLIRAQKNDKMTSNLSKWIQSGVREKGELEEDSYKILSQFYKEKKDLLYHTADGVVACKRKDEEKILHKHNLIILPQLYQTEVLFRSHDQMGHQGIDKVQQRILHRFDWPGMRKACERWVNACLACLQVKDPRKMKFPLKSVESSEFNEVVQIDHQKSA